MKIGLSLPYTYLSGNHLETDNIFNSSLGSADKALTDLSGIIEYIELSNFDTKAPSELIVGAIRNIWNHGMKVTLHPSLPREVTGQSLIEIYPWLEEILPEIEKHQESLMLNVHALASKVGDVEELRRDTITIFKWITKIIERDSLPLKFAVELNRSKGEVDPCTTYEGVQAICEQVDSPFLGIGWDMGHAYANYQNGLIPREPPGNFLKEITHTHIHDLSPQGKTHWPLAIGIVPLDEYIQLLVNCGYDGVHMLELQPGKFFEYDNAEKLIMSSIKILKASIK